MTDERAGDVNHCSSCGCGMTKAEGGTVFAVCSQCWGERDRLQALKGIKVLVWKNGSHIITQRPTWEYENDPEWLATIDPSEGHNACESVSR